MAAQIEVIDGADKGWRHTVTGAAVRIGPGPGHQIRVTDPTWPAGNLCIEPHPGGYVVTNNLPHPVYLDGKPLPPGLARTLHHGATLQPTAGTLLRLGIVAAPPGAEGVTSEPPPKPRRGLFRRALPWLALVALAGPEVRAYFRPPPPVDVVAAGKLKDALGRVEEKAALAVPVKAEVRFVRLALTDAVYHDAAGRKREAARSYQDVRDGLTRVWRAAGRPADPTGPAAVPVAGWGATDEERTMLLAAEEFVADRLKVNAAPAP